MIFLLLRPSTRDSMISGTSRAFFTAVVILFLASLEMNYFSYTVLISNTGDTALTNIDKCAAYCSFSNVTLKNSIRKRSVFFMRLDLRLST